MAIRRPRPYKQEKRGSGGDPSGGSRRANSVLPGGSPVERSAIPLDTWDRKSGPPAIIKGGNGANRGLWGAYKSRSRREGVRTGRGSPPQSNLISPGFHASREEGRNSAPV